MAEQFREACLSNNLELVQSLERRHVDTWLFWDVCKLGYLDMAKLLYMMRREILDDIDRVFEYTCLYGHLDLMQWLHSLGADISHKKNRPLMRSCESGQLNSVQWLYDKGVNITTQNNKAFISACSYNRINIVKWMIEIHYKFHGFIHFGKYYQFTSEIKDLLIDNNLVHPSQLTGCDLLYYFQRNNNRVPSDFKYHGTVPRGKHTKPALRNF